VGGVLGAAGGRLRRFGFFAFFVLCGAYGGIGGQSRLSTAASKSGLQAARAVPLPLDACDFSTSLVIKC